jgi:hypothetical protein
VPAESARPQERVKGEMNGRKERGAAHEGGGGGGRGGGGGGGLTTEGTSSDVLNLSGAIYQVSSLSQNMSLHHPKYVHISPQICPYNVSASTCARICLILCRGYRLSIHPPTHKHTHTHSQTSCKMQSPSWASTSAYKCVANVLLMCSQCVPNLIRALSWASTTAYITSQVSLALFCLSLALFCLSTPPPPPHP